MKINLTTTSLEMTDSTEESKSDNANDKEEGVCRDFVKGRCDRSYCKYKHETLPQNFNFCHDFQNSFCPRPKCRFIHCSPDEVDEYKRTGEMSIQILAEATRKNQLPGVQPICNQFRKGMCRRSNCKYRHLTKEEEDAEIMELIQSNNQRNVHMQNNFQSIPVASAGNGLQTINSLAFVSNDFANYGPSLPKRRLIAEEQLDTSRSEPIFKGYCAGTPPAPILNSADARTIMLEEQISLLHKEINQLKRQVQDLTATNEFLLDQNATLRVSNKHNVTVPNRSLTNPTAAPQQVIRTVTAGVANVPVSIATVPVSLATVPVSLTTVTTCNPVTISAVPSVSIAPTAQLLAPSPQILVTPSTQLAIANNSQAQLTIAASNAQQLAVANVPQQITLTNQGPQQLALTNRNQQQMTLTNPNQQQITLGNPNQQQITLGNPNQQQLTLANQNQQQLALANQSQHQQQMALANQNQQQVTLTSQGQQLALSSQNQQQLALGGQNQQILTQQNLAAPQQIEIHGTIQTSQPIAMSNAGQTIVSYPIVTHSINHSIQ
ncbi:zinc finger CCCH domain-containing protein 10-like [Coccinella septempunctata]|uniref:zinc finger CCCH domain-containing protein 10-like n=1 Tax=Coccinella septempunctata TaxID=41139 RepID=UPI001D083ABF|nr:zinc finger CCCH domain-containing protein 10-like [Coccinella septempunctata]